MFSRSIIKIFLSEKIKFAVFLDKASFHLIYMKRMLCLTLCMLGNLTCFLSSADYKYFSKLKFSGKNLSGIPHSASWDPDQAQHFVRPDLGPNCLQRL